MRIILLSVIFSVAASAGITGNAFEKTLDACVSTPSDKTIHIEKQLIKARKEINRLIGEVAGLNVKLKIRAMQERTRRPQRVWEVTATAYSPRVQETDSTPWETATLTRCVEGRTLAVSQDHMDWLGRRVYIPGYGVRVVEDLMNKRYKDRIDFFIENTAKAARFGKKKLKVILLD